MLRCIGWAIASILLGLGFTFFSGATEAWLVDALAATGFTGTLESVFGRAQTIGGGAMLTGSVLGGFVAQATNLGVPYILRAAMLGVTLVVAFRFMHDLGFKPDERPPRWPRSGPSSTARRRRPPQPAGALADARLAVHRRRRLLRLLRAPAVPAPALRRQPAYGIAGLAAAIVAGAQIVGGLIVGRVRRLFRRRTDALIIGSVAERRPAGPHRPDDALRVALVLLVGWA